VRVEPGTSWPVAAPDVFVNTIVRLSPEKVNWAEALTELPAAVPEAVKVMGVATAADAVNKIAAAPSADKDKSFIIRFPVL
jgi:hypothetical protein